MATELFRAPPSSRMTDPGRAWTCQRQLQADAIDERAAQDLRAAAATSAERGPIRTSAGPSMPTATRSTAWAMRKRS